MDWLIELLGSPLAAKALGWGLTAALTFVAGKLLTRWMKAGYLRDTLTRLMFEMKAAVLEVHQVYVSEISRGRADGTLTPEEKAEAKNRAMAVLKANIGKKGLARLAKVLGIEIDALDGWLGNKVEATVAELKSGTPR
jgi:hypothetical protein